MFRSLLSIAMRRLALPNDFIDEIVLAENLVEHDFDVMASVPVAVVIEAASFLKHPVQLDAAGPHVFNVRLGRFVPVFEGAFLFRFTPEHFVVPVRVERWVNIDEIDTAVRQLAKLLQIIAAINDARIDERRGFGWHRLDLPTDASLVNGHPKKDRRTNQFYASKKILQNQQTHPDRTHKGDRRHVRRNEKGQFKNEVDVGPLLAADRRRTSKRRVKPGQGDRGDVKGNTQSRGPAVMHMRLAPLTLCLTIIVLALDSPLGSSSMASTINNSRAFVGDTGIDGSAVDSCGLRHRARDHGRATPPWLNERVRAFAPDYPFADQIQRREGTGLFRLILDLKTGSVTKVVTLKSTGFATLDRCAVSAVQQWRWKPGKWKEIEMPVKFTLHDSSSRDESARLPRRN